MLRIEDADRVRTLTLDRPEALNAFSEALYARTRAALVDARTDPEVAVVVFTGAGRAFSAGTDVRELADRTSGELTGESSFPAMIDELVAFPKPILAAVNGLALGVGATMLALCDLVFFSTDARLRCPFTDLAVAPEAGSSATFPALMGHQRAFWTLTSSEWLSGEECVRYGLGVQVCSPDELLAETLRHARLLASKPLASLIECKRTIIATRHAPIAAARERENTAFARLLGAPASAEAMQALFERRPPDFVAVDRAHPVDVARHAAD